MKNKKAFSFVELIIVITIITLLAIVAVKISSDSKEKTTNTKIKADISSISLALNQAYEAEKKVPMPDGNLNYFKNNGAYSHENFDNTEDPAFGVYGKITGKSLGKEYLTEVPKDPRTNQYYSYGITKEKDNFEVAGVIKEKGNFLAKVVGNYRGDKGINSLIREYNGPYFVIDEGENLPYNPEKILLTANDTKGNIFEEGDILTYEGGKFFKSGNQIQVETKTDDGKIYYDLYFSDGNVGRVEVKDKVKLTFGKDNGSFKFENNNLKSKIALFLEAGSMWVFASDLNQSESSFNVITQDITAAVRGTIFRVDKNNSSTNILLVKGKLLIKENGIDTSVNDTTNGNFGNVKVDNQFPSVPFIEESKVEEVPYVLPTGTTGIDTTDTKQRKFTARGVNYKRNSNNILEHAGFYENKDIILTKDNIKYPTNGGNENKYYGYSDGKFIILDIDDKGKIIMTGEYKLRGEGSIDYIKYENNKIKDYNEDLIYSFGCIGKDMINYKLKNICNENYNDIIRNYTLLVEYKFDKAGAEEVFKESIENVKEENGRKYIKFKENKEITLRRKNKTKLIKNNGARKNIIEVTVKGSDLINYLNTDKVKASTSGGEDSEILYLKFEINNNPNNYIKYRIGGHAPFEYGNNNTLSFGNPANFEILKNIEINKNEYYKIIVKTQEGYSKTKNNKNKVISIYLLEEKGNNVVFMTSEHKTNSWDIGDVSKVYLKTKNILPLYNLKIYITY